jgi:hypothetical protein
MWLSCVLNDYVGRWACWQWQWHCSIWTKRGGVTCQYRILKIMMNNGGTQ